ncbi:Dual specificity phosphatase, catalytic domain [uncultured archaeon]|nr:Dual specificity phosphatase, catalytic domain [uncultured archaeon]
MITKINERICIGDNSSCFCGDKDGWVVIHACKIPCHQMAVGYKGSLPKNHQNYLIKEDEKNLYLNMIDNDIWSPQFIAPMIKRYVEFMKKNIKNNVLIHCNVGLSRSPALALIFLAKISKEISNDSYDDAKNDFLKLYPAYKPGYGVDDYLRKYWNDLNSD